mmetsp:Transcript_22244/g.26721  ORF Transcript_22244/g.26721 Transcript_22244/m.26721 type:complete len:119 (+) Transcript_22244:135-491(+)
MATVRFTLKEVARLATPIRASPWVCSSRTSFHYTSHNSNASEEGSSGGHITQVAKEDFNSNMLQFIACPETKQPLRYDPETHELISDHTNTAYQIVEGIPRLIRSEGRKLDSNKEVEN